MFTRINNSVIISNEIFNESPNGGIARYFRNIIRYFSSNEVEKANHQKILHLTYYSLAPAILGILLGRFIITTIHDAIYEEGLEKNSIVVVRKFLCCVFSSHIIFVSKTSRYKYFKRFPCLRRKKNSVIYHFSSFARQAADKITIQTEPSYILYVGNRSGYKNCKELLDFAISNSGYNFIFVGGEAAELVYPDNVKFLKNVTDLDLVNLYKGALVLVTTSKDEGFNIPVIEAQSLGCPVICTDIEVHREVAGAGAMYIPCQNYSVTLKKYLEFLTVSEVRDRFKHLGWLNSERFSSNTFFMSHRAIYES
jgi:glycosyltransferase involved in cell wall biosynthesis